MKHANLKALRRRLFIKHACIIVNIALGTITPIYLFDDVLNGVVIGSIRLLTETGGPFAMFHKICMIVLSLLIVATIILMICFLCRDLVNYMRILMRDMEDVMCKDRSRLNFPKEMKEAEQLIMALSDGYQNYLRAAAQDEEKKKDSIYLLTQDIKMLLSNILMYLEFLYRKTRISPEIQKDFVIQVLHKSLDLEDMINEFFGIIRFSL